MQFCGSVFDITSEAPLVKEAVQYLQNADVDFLKSITIIEFLNCIKENIMLHAELQTFPMNLLTTLAYEMRRCVLTCLDDDGANFDMSLRPFRNMMKAKTAIHCIGVAMTILHGLGQLGLNHNWSSVLALFGQVCEIAALDAALRLYFQLAPNGHDAEFTAESGHKLVQVTKIYEKKISFTPAADPSAKLHYLPSDRQYIKCGVAAVPVSLNICSPHSQATAGLDSQTEAWIRTALSFVVYHRAIRPITDDYFGVKLRPSESAIYKEVIHYLIKSQPVSVDYKRVVTTVGSVLQQRLPSAASVQESFILPIVDHVYNALSTIYKMQPTEITLGAQYVSAKAAAINTMDV